jgi:hypothetical protein
MGTGTAGLDRHFGCGILFPCMRHLKTIKVSRLDYQQFKEA